MTEATFRVEVTQADAEAFARLSGDWNPLHTDAEHAARTVFRQPVLHGAFSAALISRLAGMYLPGRDCLLHYMRLRFVAPIRPPASLIVAGHVVSETHGIGRVEASVADADTGTRHVEATYEFSRQEMLSQMIAPTATPISADAPILITGATGGLGSALLARLGQKALGVSRRAHPGLLVAPNVQNIAGALNGQRIGAIVHCAWPSPDNEGLLALANPGAAVDHHVARPVRDMLMLARLLAVQGVPDAMLVLVGSTFAEPGRHGYRMPLYTLAKSLVPTLTRILALELAPRGQRAVTVVFDVIDGGMNKALSPTIRQVHADRVPAGRLADPDEAAAQIIWLLDNRSHLVSGATVVLSGGALP